jgi:hypothetical protein
MNANIMIKQVYIEAYEKIDDIKNLFKEIKAGKHNGKIWSCLESDPIQSTLKALADYDKIVINNKIEMNGDQDFVDLASSKISNSLFEVLVTAENELAEFLIQKQNDREVKQVLQNIKATKFGFSALKRIELCSENPEKKWTIKPLPPLPDDVMLLLFLKNGVVSLARLSLTSKNYYNNQNLWKKLCLEESPALLELYPGLKKLDDKKINWRAVSLDVFSNLERHTSNNLCEIIFGNNHGMWGNSSYCIIDKNKITYKKIQKKILEYYKKFITSCDEEFEEKMTTSELKFCKFYYNDKFLNKLSDSLFLKKWLHNKTEIVEWSFDYGKVLLYNVYNIYNVNQGEKYTELTSPKEVPPEWLIQEEKKMIEDDNRHQCKCILF